MRSVWKFTMSGPGQRTKVVMPVGAIVLSVGVQDGAIVFWADVKTENDVEGREYVVVGTGWDVPADAMYQGTVQEPPYVWHLFEV